MVVSLAACGTAATKKGYKVGFAFYGLTDPVWAELVKEAVTYGAGKGVEVTYVDAGKDPSKQVTQIENFIQSKMDAIVVLAIDTTALIDVTNKAKAAGIKIVDYSRGLKTADTSLSLDPKANGLALAEMATEWIKANFKEGEPVDWAFLNIPTVELGVEEGAATEASMKKLLPNAKMVATASTLTVEEGLTNTENFLQSDPNLRVILSLSGGGGVGGNEAVKAAIPKEKYSSFGLFSIDATEEEALNIIRADPEKGSISLGGGAEHGRLLVDMCIKLIKGETVAKSYPLPILKVDSKNAQKYYDDTFKK
jgi:ribose transport system substrate-binding protein